MITAEKVRYRNLVIEDLRIAPGITSLIGPNGSGKTTLLKLLAGVAVPDTGAILIDGVPPRSTEIGWVNEFPDRNILFGNIFEEIASPLRFRHMPCTTIEDSVIKCMESLGITHLRTRPMQELSGGEKVLAALAAALVFRPKVLVLDEYDSHLDAQRAGEILDIIRKNNTQYVIQCTQDLEAAAQGDGVIFLKEGKIRYAGKPEDVFTSLAGTEFYPLTWRCHA